MHDPLYLTHSSSLQDLVREIAAGAALPSSNHTLFKLEDISMGAWVEHVGKTLRWCYRPPQHCATWNACFRESESLHLNSP